MNQSTTLALKCIICEEPHILDQVICIKCCADLKDYVLKVRSERTIVDEKTAAVAKCRTMYELKDVIRTHSPFQSERVKWTSSMLFEAIETIIKGNGGYHWVPEVNGIRDKVKELLDK